LFSLAALLFFIELLLPSGGVLGLASLVSGIGGVIAFWFHSSTLGITSLIGLLILIPIAFQFALRVIPNTPIGRMLILGNEEKDLEKAEAAFSEGLHELDALIGKQGRALTELRPVGIAEIEGETHDVLAEAGVIDSGSTICVVSTSDGQIKVRAV